MGFETYQLIVGCSHLMTENPLFFFLLSHPYPVNGMGIPARTLT